MKTHQYNKLETYETVHSLLAAAPETAGIPALAPAFARFNAKCEALRELCQRQTARLTPTLVQRDEILGPAVREALRIAGIVQSYAHGHDDPLLAAQVRLTPREMRDARLDRRVPLAQQVHDATLSVIDELAGYGLTRATLAAFQAQLDAAAAAVTLPRDAMVIRVAATQQVAVALREIDALLKNEIDPLLLPLQHTHSEFYARYKFSRRIVNRPARRAADSPVAPVDAAAEVVAFSAAPSPRAANTAPPADPVDTAAAAAISLLACDHRAPCPARAANVSLVVHRGPQDCLLPPLPPAEHSITGTGG